MSQYFSRNSHHHVDGNTRTGFEPENVILMHVDGSHTLFLEILIIIELKILILSVLEPENEAFKTCSSIKKSVKQKFINIPNFLKRANLNT